MNELVRLNGASFSEGQERARDVLCSSARYVCLWGGTRSGKTFLIVRGIIHRALRAPDSRHLLARFRTNAARASLSLDTIPKVMRTCFPGVQLEEHRQDGFWQTPNGAQLFVSGLDDKDRVEKILGTEYATIYLNEASQISYDSMLTAQTRLAQDCPGLKQRFIVDLNPVGKSHWTNKLFVQKVDPKSNQPLKDPDNYKYGRLNPVDNAHNLSAEYIKSLANMPPRQRQRFYEGAYLDEIDGALWTLEMIESCRVTLDDIPAEQRQRLVVAVDPSGASSNKDENKNSDDIGIVVAAKGTDGHGYVLEDLSVLTGPSGPEGWAQRAVDAYHRYKADHIVAEKNYGGEMVRAVIQARDSRVPVKLVNATRGKTVRAAPIALLYSAGKVHHAGSFPKLEEQLCAFNESGYTATGSPDNADASIWALTELLLEEEVPTAQTGSYRTSYGW